MTLRFHPPKPSIEALKARAASGSRGCVEARKQLMALRHEQLADEVNKKTT